ncbi:MAG: DUF533 domain-containing protein [Deltaproteobacteria bacterium]|nr:DUF533 domain-containing protein [Deltaproteobacteria bacterium]
MDATVEKTIQALIATAWADGQVGDDEQEVIETVLDAYGVMGDEAARIREWAKTRRTLEQLDLGSMAEVDAVLLLQQAVFVTYIDGVQTDQELELLHELARKLGLQQSRANELIRTTTARAKARYEEERAAAH